MKGLKARKKIATSTTMCSLTALRLTLFVGTCERSEPNWKPRKDER